MDKKTFVLHIDKMNIIYDFTDEERGRLLTAIVEYQKNGIILDKEYLGNIYYLFKGSFVPQFEADNKKYTAMIERNRKNGVKNVKKNTNVSTQWDPAGSSRCQSMPVDASGRLTDTDTDTDTGTDTGTVLKKEKINQNPLTSLLFNAKESLQSNFSACENLSQSELETHENDKAVILANQGHLPLVTTDVPKNKKTASQGRKNGSRIDPDLILSDEWIACAYGACEKRGFDIEIKDIEIEFEKFKNYWLAKSGSGASKLDWLATWRNWFLNFQKPIYRTSSGYKPYQSKGDIRREDSVAIKNFVAEAEARSGKKYGIFS